MTFAELSSELIGTLALSWCVGFGVGLVFQQLKRMLDFI